MNHESFHYEIEHVTGDRAGIVLSGVLEGASLSGLGESVRNLLGGLPAGSGIVIDLTAVARCDPAACRTLARIQRRLKAHCCRTAWLAERPRLRGVAWWVVHAAQDPMAMPVTDRCFAERWLETGEQRLDQLEARTHGAWDRSERARASAIDPSGAWRRGVG